MANQRIRDAARIANVPQWKIAKEFGLSEEYFCKKLRFEFSREEEKKALRIIERIVLNSYDSSRTVETTKSTLF